MFDGRAERRRGPIPLIRAVVDVPCIGFIFQQEFKRYGGIFLTERIPESSSEPLQARAAASATLRTFWRFVSSAI